MPEASPKGGLEAAPGEGKRYDSLIHNAWRIGAVLTIITGLFHLFNLVDAGRFDFGPLLLTPFRVAFLLSWILLLLDYAINRRRPEIDGADAMIAAVSLVFLLRAVFTADTFGISVNWLVTGVGVFYLIKHGIRERADACLMLATVALAAIALAAFGLFEYAVKANPLFDAVQIKVIGADLKVEASDQYYRVRSLVGHPGYTAAVLLVALPIVMMLLWKRRWVGMAAGLLIAITIFLTFSRGSWFVAVIALVPVCVYLGRSRLSRPAKWVVPMVLLAALVLAADYWSRDEVSISLKGRVEAKGINLVNNGGQYRAYEPVNNDGIKVRNSLMYFDVDDGFYHGGDGPVTVVFKYLDAGLGGIHIDYDSNQAPDHPKATSEIFKSDSGQWSTAVIYIEDPGFNDNLDGADFRIADVDNQTVISNITMQKGRLKLLSVAMQQWRSRAGSFSTRMDFFPFTWDMLREHPLGVGLFNTPGTEHHAIDSLPLTWMIEFGWPGLLLIGGLAFITVREGMRVYHQRSAPVAVLYLSLLLVILHGGHLMILYDKPTLVLTAVIGAVYVNARPWRRGGPVFDLDEVCRL